jgi:hypothetical protein
MLKHEKIRRGEGGAKASERKKTTYQSKRCSTVCIVSWLADSEEE